MHTRPSDPIQFDHRRWMTHLGRGARRRCPNCGGGGLFQRWIVMEQTCPNCNLILDRNEPDYFLGSYVINFVTAEFTIAAGALAVILMTWPDVPWTALKWALIGLMIPGPIVFYPFAKTLWLAIDLTLRPPTWADLSGHGENVDAPTPN